jgi:hypothetical protein
MGKYYTCIYDLEGNLISSRKSGCSGCAAKRLPKLVPACIRRNSTTGQVVKSNKMFKDLGDKVK